MWLFSGMSLATGAVIFVGASNFELFRSPTPQESFWNGIAFLLLIIGGVCTFLIPFSLIRDFSGHAKPGRRP